MGELIEYVARLGVQDHTVTYVWGKPDKTDILEPSIELYEKAVRLVSFQRYARNSGGVYRWAMRLVNGLSDYTMLAILRNKEPMYHCRAVKKFAVLTANGEVMACHMRSNSLGNVRDVDYDLPGLLKSSQAKALVRDIHDTRCYCSAQCLNRNNVIYSLRTLWYLVRYFPHLSWS